MMGVSEAVQASKVTVQLEPRDRRGREERLMIGSEARREVPTIATTVSGRRRDIRAVSIHMTPYFPTVSG
jgi:hypothetical protein